MKSKMALFFLLSIVLPVSAMERGDGVVNEATQLLATDVVQDLIVRLQYMESCKTVKSPQDAAFYEELMNRFLKEKAENKTDLVEFWQQLEALFKSNASRVQLIHTSSKIQRLPGDVDLSFVASNHELNQLCKEAGYVPTPVESYTREVCDLAQSEEFQEEHAKLPAQLAQEVLRQLALEKQKSNDANKANDSDEESDEDSAGGNNFGNMPGY